MAGKGKQIQVDFVHKPNQHLIIESRSNLSVIHIHIHTWYGRCMDVECNLEY